MNTSGTYNRPTTAATTPSYMRSKADNAHNNNNRRAMSASPQGKLMRMNGLDADESEMLSGMSPSRHADITGPNPTPFHSVYEISYSPPRERPETCPNNRRGFGSEPTALPAHINPASLREKKEYLFTKSRDAPPATSPSKYIVEFQHHMRNEAKAEVSRHVRKTEPPNLAPIFGIIDDDISVREIIHRRNDKLRSEAAERDRQRSLLYNRAEFHARHTDEDGRSAVIDTYLKSSTGSNGRKATSFRASTSEKPPARDPFSNSPPRYRELYFNQKQFDKHAKPGWDTEANAKKMKRQLEQEGGWRSDWAASISPSENAASVSRTAASLAREFNRAQAAGLPTDYQSVIRKQRLDSPQEIRDVPDKYQDEEDVAQLKALQQRNRSGSAGMNEHKIPKRAHSAGGNPAVGGYPNNAILSSRSRRILPSSIREKVHQERTPNEVVMKYVVDPVLRMELIEKQRNWRSEYEKLKDELHSEADRKNAVLKEIRDLQRQKERGNASAGQSTLALV